VQNNYVVVADSEGYVHWLQTSDGALAARERCPRSRSAPSRWWWAIPCTSRT